MCSLLRQPFSHYLLCMFYVPYGWMEAHHHHHYRHHGRSTTMHNIMMLFIKDGEFMDVVLFVLEGKLFVLLGFLWCLCVCFGMYESQLLLFIIIITFLFPVGFYASHVHFICLKHNNMLTVHGFNFLSFVCILNRVANKSKINRKTKSHRQRKGSFVT